MIRVRFAVMEELFNAGGWQIILDSADLPDGRTKKVPRVERADSVHLLAMPEEGKIIVIREYRPYYGQYIWMLPSGRADKEKDMAVAAQRELQEETGYKAGKLDFLWSVNHSESLIMTNHFFTARDLTHDPLPQDEDELIEVHVCTPQEALEKVHTSPKVHLPSAYGLMRYMHESI